MCARAGPGNIGSTHRSRRGWILHSTGFSVSIFQLAFDLFRIIMIDSESVCLNLEIERNLRSNMQIPTRCSTFHGLVFGHKRTGLDLFIDIDPHAGPHSQDWGLAV